MFKISNETCINHFPGVDFLLLVVFSQSAGNVLIPCLGARPTFSTHAPKGLVPKHLLLLCVMVSLA